MLEEDWLSELLLSTELLELAGLLEVDGFVLGRLAYRRRRTAFLIAGALGR